MVWTRISLRYRTELHIFRRGFVIAVRYLYEILNPTVRLYATAVGTVFVLMEDKTRPHGAVVADDYLESEGTARTEWMAYSPDLYSMPSRIRCLIVYPLPQALSQSCKLLYKRNVGYWLYSLWLPRGKHSHTV